MRSVKGSSAWQTVDAGEAVVGAGKAVVGAGNAVVGADKTVVDTVVGADKAVVDAGKAVVGADKAVVGADKTVVDAVVGAGKAGVGVGEVVVGMGEAEEGTLWTLISGVSESVDKDITAALQEAVDNHAPLKASVCKLPLVVCARLSLGLLPCKKRFCLGIQRCSRGFRCEAGHKGGCQRFP